MSRKEGVPISGEPCFTEPMPRALRIPTSDSDAFMRNCSLARKRRKSTYCRRREALPHRSCRFVKEPQPFPRTTTKPTNASQTGGECGGNYEKTLPGAETPGNDSYSSNDVRRIRKNDTTQLAPDVSFSPADLGSVVPTVPPALCRRDEIPDLRERFRQKFYVRMSSSQPNDDFPRVS